MDEDHQTKISARTIQRRLGTWGLTHRTKTVLSEELRIRIRELYFEGSMSNEEMARTLRTEGFSITAGCLRNVRSEMKLMRRVRSAEAKNYQEAEIRAAIEEELPHGIIQGYSRRLCSSASSNTSPPFWLRVVFKPPWSSPGLSGFCRCHSATSSCR